jgi:polyhydroxyalkanoate synthesis regulator phasin
VVKMTKSQARQLAEELLNIRSFYERYQEAEKQLKAAMVELGLEEIKVPHRGRVFVSTSQRVSIAPDLARDVLGALANKIIEVKESVSNKLLDALVTTGDIEKDQQEQLVAGAKKTDVVSLYVRPLQ